MGRALRTRGLRHGPHGRRSRCSHLGQAYGGFSDIGFAVLTGAGLIRLVTTIFMTVYDLQALSEELPQTPHDFMA